jgi:hypothetical protein
VEQFESPSIRSGLMNLKVRKEIKNITINGIKICGLIKQRTVALDTA